MKKLHLRLSVEVEVPNKLFKQIINEATIDGKLYDIEVSYLKELANLKKAKPCLDGGWDDGGYVPSSWLEYDAVNSGLYELKSWVDERGLMHDKLTRKKGTR